MAKVVSNKNESVRMFENPILERFSHIHPATPIVFWTPVILYFAYLGAQQLNALSFTASFLDGVLFWTFLEYTLHRFAFHYKPSSKAGKRFVFLVHGVHHDYPRDATRLVMPLGASIPLAIVFYALFTKALGPFAQAAFSGLVSGYLAYDCLHFAFHHFAMKGKIASYLKAYHLKHHYVNPDSGYGVSNPLWDVVFRTLPQANHMNANDLENLDQGYKKAA
ncbi:MAG: sterol desaturase family protein [Deltaproteobacteria bacterium]|nr:sterol desaturase family protein [Deltaproteobacteria bacterium]